MFLRKSFCLLRGDPVINSAILFRTVLADVRSFCKNTDGRLVAMYEEWVAKEGNRPKSLELEQPVATIAEETGDIAEEPSAAE